MRFSIPALLHGACLALVSVLCLGCLVSVPASCAADPLADGARPALSFAPLTTHVQPGEACTLQVLVDDAVDSLSCMEIFVSFDTAYAVCTAALEGQLYKAAPFPRFFRWEHPVPDTVSAVDCVLGYRSYIVAPGELVSFVFRAVKNGVCRVYFQKTSLFDVDRIALDPIKGAHAEIIVGQQSGGVPAAMGAGSLANYPNPFNPATLLILLLPEGSRPGDAARVSVEVYRASGARVRSLFDGRMQAGRHEIPWDGKDDEGHAVAAGVYLAVAKTGRDVLTRKIVMVR